MDYTAKKAAYQALVAQVRNYYESCPNDLCWCEDNQEINLWTYWQGRNNLDAKIFSSQIWYWAIEQKAAAAVSEKAGQSTTLPTLRN